MHLQNPTKQKCREASKETALQMLAGNKTTRVQLNKEQDSLSDIFVTVQNGSGDTKKTNTKTSLVHH